MGAGAVQAAAVLTCSIQVATRGLCAVIRLFKDAAPGLRLRAQIVLSLLRALLTSVRPQPILRHLAHRLFPDNSRVVAKLDGGDPHTRLPNSGRQAEQEFGADAGAHFFGVDAVDQLLQALNGRLGVAETILAGVELIITRLHNGVQLCV